MPAADERQQPPHGSWRVLHTPGCGRLRRDAPGACTGRRAGPVRRTRATPASVVMEKRGEPSPGALDRGGSPATSSLRGRGTEVDGCRGSAARFRRVAGRREVRLGTQRRRFQGHARTGVACAPVPLLPKGQSRGPIGLRGRRGASHGATVIRPSFYTPGEAHERHHVRAECAAGQRSKPAPRSWARPRSTLRPRRSWTCRTAVSA
jgi:hypothetical protein